MIELKIVAEMLNKDFRDTSQQDIAKLLERIERMDRSERTRGEYKLLIRRFYRWLGKSGPVNWIIKKMINACEHPRDRALAACLCESGARISELGNLKIMHVKFDRY